ncbi:site-specific integrase [Catellatospora sp. NPDC049133]|uniref:tyrosine-type recombinase/integrase n=1 Tax=Catellatospora sp. NPDC049133 TaxID=3155499 RepID=UPI0033EF161A
MDRANIAEGTPFLLSPRFEYDVELNGFFKGLRMSAAPRTTRAGYACDLARFLTFLWVARGGRSWRDATEDDHVAYLVWRRRDPAGPRVAGSTWNREVAAVNQFYRWALSRGLVNANPIPQRLAGVVPSGWHRGGGSGGRVPATYSHDGATERVQWLPPVSYRQWRDVGLRGFGADGLPDRRFRGRWAARNALFADLMVRTGLRLSEQASLSVFEVPTDAGGVRGYQRFWLPAAIAKGGSARWVYVPSSLVAELAVYASVDRAEVVATARRASRYGRMRQPLVVADAARPVVSVAGQPGSRHQVAVAKLDPVERRSALVDNGDGPEPAAFWLGEDGMPLSVPSWKGIFAAANVRCRGRGVDVACHPHMLRHTFAVVTLEQLQRGHLAALAGFTAEQRGHYVRVFGDPLDWVRRRLGHRSLTSTMVYLHALAELEMHTRMALVPDEWEDPASCGLDDTEVPAAGAP